MFHWLTLPFRWLVGGLRGFSEIIDWLFGSLGRDSDRPWWQAILLFPILLPYWLIRGIFSLLAYPFSLRQLDPQRRLNVYYGLPAMAAMIIVVFSLIYAFVSTKAIDDLYRSGMQRSLAKGDFKTAVILGGRLVSNRFHVDAPTRFEYAIALARNGELTRSEAMLAVLAPTDKVGYGPAHFARAQSLAGQVAQQSSTKLLEQLRWHLENTKQEDSEDVQRLWAVYYVKVGQLDKAVPYLERATMSNSRLLLSLADLYAKMGDKQAELRALRNSETQLRRSLADNPLSLQDRLQLSMTLVKLDRSSEAEELILKGVELHNDKDMRRAAAQYYILQFDMLRAKDPDDFKGQFQFLEKAFRFDLSFQVTYERLIEFYLNAKQGEEAELIRKKLDQLLVEGASPSLVHFALSSLYQIDGDSERALFHLQLSYRSNPNLPVVVNNLAWMFANQESPDLARALELSQIAINLSPNDPSFIDTLATILMKQEKFADAITHFESILAVANNKAEIHLKLSECYSKIGRKDLAALHATKSEELRAKL